jgi:SPP1 gp7 family putative phage head morphogenesis protein
MNARDLVEFFDAPAAASFTLVPEQALAFFRAKGLATSFAWQDLVADEHATAFTVAKMMDVDLLRDVQTSLADALERGVPFREWADSITQVLQGKGWWGRQRVVDPISGQLVVAELGSPGRLRTIFRTNMQSAYSVGAWQRIQQQAAEAPYLLYDAVDDHRTRPEHAAWDGRVYPVDSPFWRQHYPPNGWNCRCGVIQLSDDDLEALGLKVSPPPRIHQVETPNPRTGGVMRHPVGVDASFAYNPGQLRQEQLQRLALEKVQALDDGLKRAALDGIDATKRQAQDVTKGVVATPVDAEDAARAAMRAAERRAQAELDEALAKSTPYLARAIRELDGRGLGPVELLERAKARAAKLKDQALLTQWRTAYLAGREPPAAARAVFDAMPEEAQRALREKLDAMLAAKAAAQLRFDPTTPAGKWHTKAWDNAPDWLRPVLVREQAVEVLPRKGNGAWASVGRQVQMGRHAPETERGRDVWRHEFGHILDWRLGERLGPPGPGRRSVHRSSAQDFTDAMRKDSADLQAAAKSTGRFSVQEALDLARGYDTLRDTIVDLPGSAERQAFLARQASALGFDLDELRTVFKANSTASFDGIAGDVRMARALRALELRDVERFLFELAGRDNAMEVGRYDATYWAGVTGAWEAGVLASLADLFGAASRNALVSIKRGFPGHDEGYYRKRAGYGQQTEAFANLTALAAAPSPLWWRMVERLAPNMARTYREIVTNGGR